MVKCKMCLKDKSSSEYVPSKARKSSKTRENYRRKIVYKMRNLKDIDESTKKALLSQYIVFERGVEVCIQCCLRDYKKVTDQFKSFVEPIGNKPTQTESRPRKKKVEKNSFTRKPKSSKKMARKPKKATKKKNQSNDSNASTFELMVNSVSKEIDKLGRIWNDYPKHHSKAKKYLIEKLKTLGEQDRFTI